jgi:hypothetical protein
MILFKSSLVIRGRAVGGESMAAQFRRKSSLMPTWMALLIAAACTAALWVRLAFLRPTWKLRRRIAIGLTVGASVGFTQSAIKHTSQPWGLLIIADAYFALFVSLIGAGGAIERRQFNLYRAGRRTFRSESRTAWCSSYSRLAYR